MSCPVAGNLECNYRGSFELGSFWWGNGESAGARTQDQRLKRAMLYQLSYALRPHYQVTTFSRGNLAAKQRHCKLLQSLCFFPLAPLRDSQPSLIVKSFRRKKRLKRRPLRLENCLAYSCLFRIDYPAFRSTTILSWFRSFYAVIPHVCCTVTLKSHDGFIDLG